MNAKGFWGAAFMVLGGGLAVLAGGCTVVFEVMAFEAPKGGEQYLTPGLPLVIGGIPALVGAGLFFLGRKLRRDAAAPQKSGGK